MGFAASPSWRRAGARLSAALALAVCLVAASGRPAAASAWNQPAGQGFVLLDATLDQGDRYFDKDGRLAPARSYRSEEAAGYVEYGITDWLMAVARPSVDVTRIGAPDAARYVGPGATEAGAQLHLLAFGPAVFAVQGTFRLPGTASRRDPAEVGNTAREGDFRVLGGIGGFNIGPMPVFLDVQGAYRLRSNGAAAEWHGDLTVGLTVTPKLLLLVQSFNQLPSGAGTAWLPSSAYSKLEVSAVQRLTPTWAVQIGGFTSIAGRKALRERGATVGVWHNF